MSTLLKCPFPHPQLGRLGFARQPSGFWVLLSWPRMDSEQVDQSGQNTAPTSAAEARDEAEIGREGAVPGATDKIAPGPDVQNEEHDAPDDPNGSKAGGDASVTAQWTGAALQSMLWGLVNDESSVDLPPSMNTIISKLRACDWAGGDLPPHILDDCETPVGVAHAMMNSFRWCSFALEHPDFEAEPLGFAFKAKTIDFAAWNTRLVAAALHLDADGLVGKAYGSGLDADLSKPTWERQLRQQIAPVQTTTRGCHSPLGQSAEDTLKAQLAAVDAASKLDPIAIQPFTIPALKALKSSLTKLLNFLSQQRRPASALSSSQSAGSPDQGHSNRLTVGNCPVPEFVNAYQANDKSGVVAEELPGKSQTTLLSNSDLGTPRVLLPVDRAGMYDFRLFTAALVHNPSSCRVMKDPLNRPVHQSCYFAGQMIASADKEPELDAPDGYRGHRIRVIIGVSHAQPEVDNDMRANALIEAGAKPPSPLQFRVLGLVFEVDDFGAAMADRLKNQLNRCLAEIDSAPSVQTLLKRDVPITHRWLPPAAVPTRDRAGADLDELPAFSPSNTVWQPVAELASRVAYAFWHNRALLVERPDDPPVVREDMTPLAPQTLSIPVSSALQHEVASPRSSERGHTAPRRYTPHSADNEKSVRKTGKGKGGKSPRSRSNRSSLKPGKAGAEKKTIKNPYLMFCQSQRGVVTSEMPHLSPQEIVIELGRRWRLQKDKSPTVDPPPVPLSGVSDLPALSQAVDSVALQKRPLPTPTLPLSDDRSIQASPSKQRRVESVSPEVVGASAGTQARATPRPSTRETELAAQALSAANQTLRLQERQILEGLPPEAQRVYRLNKIAWQAEDLQQAARDAELARQLSDASHRS
eukprot:m.355066 g.355066  ORF g.355066 m.355066 type:complete len:867 (-) comp16597_c1_seq14:3373-5973(-)